MDLLFQIIRRDLPFDFSRLYSVAGCLKKNFSVLCLTLKRDGGLP